MKASIEKIHELTVSGQRTTIKLLQKKPCKPSTVEKIKKKLDVLDDWTANKETVCYKGESVLCSLAVWRKCIEVDFGKCLIRFYILSVFHSHYRYDFAVPGNLSEIKRLPELDFSASDVELLIKMANTISNHRKSKITTIEADHPAKETMRKNTQLLSNALVEGQQIRLVDLLNSSLILRFLVIAAIDIQLHGVKKLRGCPRFLYNIYAGTGDRARFDERGEWGSVLSALTINNERGPFGYSPIRLRLNAKRDLGNYSDIHGRFFFITYREKANLTPILDDYDNAVVNVQSGDSHAAPQYDQALLCGPSILNYPFVFQYQDALTTPTNISTEDLLLLRTAVSQVINKGTADSIRKRWNDQIANPGNLLVSSRDLWLRTLIETVSDHWFRDNESLRVQFANCWDESIQAGEQMILHTEQNLKTAFSLLVNLALDSDLVFDGDDASKRDIEEALSGSHIAFLRTLKKGPDEGRPLLCFTKDSLLRFLHTAELDESLLPAFIDHCREMGVYCERKNVPTSTQTIDVKAFYVDELVRYRSEVDE